MKKPSLRTRILKFFHRHNNAKVFGILSPCIFWIGIFFLLPLVIMAIYSFLERGLYGGVNWVFTWWQKKSGYTAARLARELSRLYLRGVRPGS